uniref:Uncharacterized protein n=1 Tax=Romanomermis culicivorax TaxID=13658 RepID=A0A915KFY5_ROMCU
MVTVTGRDQRVFCSFERSIVGYVDVIRRVADLTKKYGMLRSTIFSYGPFCHLVKELNFFEIFDKSLFAQKCLRTKGLIITVRGATSWRG